MQFSASWRLLGQGSNNEGDGCEIWVMSEGKTWDQWRNMYHSRRVVGSDVPALAWPESPSFGLALGGLGLRKS